MPSNAQLTYVVACHGILMPEMNCDKKYTRWQGVKSNDIEHAFSVLQGKFQVMACPFQAHDLERFSTFVSCCMMIHNVCMSDQLMDGNFYARYNPAYNVTDMELKENIDL